MCGKVFDIAKNLKYDGYQCGLASMVQWFIHFLIIKLLLRVHGQTLATQNKFASSGIKNEGISNKELAQKLHKSIISIFSKSKLAIYR